MREGSGRTRPAVEAAMSGTRERILVALCRRRQTVSELAGHFGLTENAVRAQLERLERDGLVAKAGSRPGVRKPHVEYGLTPAALKRFPRAYEPVLVQLVSVVTDRLAAGASRAVLV